MLVNRQARGGSSATPAGDNPEVTIAGNSIKFAGVEESLYRPPPTLGQHTDEVLEEFGISPGERSAPDPQ